MQIPDFLRPAGLEPLILQNNDLAPFLKRRISKKGAKYFWELSRRSTREGIEHGAPEDDRLPILLDGREVGVVMPDDAVRARKEWLDEPEASELFHRAGDVAAEVREYMTPMETAPPLKASSLDAPYELLANFNGCALGGMESSRGVQFTTWQEGRYWLRSSNSSSWGVEMCGNLLRFPYFNAIFLYGL